MAGNGSVLYAFIDRVLTSVPCTHQSCQHGRLRISKHITQVTLSLAPVLTDQCQLNGQTEQMDGKAARYPFFFYIDVTGCLRPRCSTRKPRS